MEPLSCTYSVAIAHAKSPSVGVYIEELMTLVTSDEPYSKLASWVAPGGLKLQGIEAL